MISFKLQLDPEAEGAIEIAKSWGKEELSPIHFANYILSIGQKNIVIPSQVKKVIDMGWDYFGKISSSIHEYNEFKKLKYSTRRNKEKGARLVCGAVIKELNNSSRFINILASTGALGVASLATTVSLTVTIAALSWGAAALSCVRLNRALKKKNNPVFWLEDTLEIYNNIKNKIILYQAKRTVLENQPDQIDKINQINKINQQIDELNNKANAYNIKQLLLPRSNFQIIILCHY